MANKIRLGFEFAAVCATHPESAEEARQAFGAKLAS